MAIDLITHGAGEALFYTLNAMARLFEGGKSSAIGGLMILGGMIASTAVVAKLVGSFNLAIPMNWFMTYMLLLTSIAIPKADVIIIDRVTGFSSPVSNVPYLFALPAGYLSQIGDWLARKSDDAFSIPSGSLGEAPRTLSDALRYSKSGVAMTSKIVAAASHADFISNDTFKNFKEYVSECVVYDIALGKYSVDHLLSQDNMWAYIKSKASPHGGVIYGERQDDGSVKNDFFTCREAAARLDATWNKEIKDASFAIGKTLYPKHPDPSRILKENLVSAYGYLAGVSKSADEIMQQNIMRNAVEAGFLTRAKQYGSVESIHGYSVAKSDAMQEANYAIQGGMATKSVAMLKIVIEILFYGIFPFVAIIAVLPGAASIIKTYLVGLMWLQSWAPLYSLINMVINVYAKTKVSSIAGASILTASSIPDLGNASASVSKFASYASMCVPFLSYTLFKGASALSQMSAHFGAASQSAAGSGASEAVTGNISQGNRSFDTSTRSVTSFYKHDDNASVASGAFRSQNSDGSVSTNYSKEDVLDRTGSISKLGAQIFSGEQLAGHMNQAASLSHQRAQSLTEESREALNFSMSEFSNLQDTKSSAQSVQQILGYDESSALCNSTVDALNHQNSESESFAKSRGIKGEVFGEFSGSGGVSIMGKGAKLSGGFRGAGYIDRHASASESDQRTHSFGVNERADEIIREYGSLSEQKRDEMTKVLGSGWRASMDKAYSKSLAASQSEQEALSLQNSASMIDSQSSGYSVDLSQDAINYAKNIGYSDSDFSTMMSNQNHRTQFMQGFLKEQHANIEERFISGANNVRSSYSPEKYSVNDSLSESVKDSISNLEDSVSQNIKDDNLKGKVQSFKNVHADFSSEVITKTNKDIESYNVTYNRDRFDTKEDLIGTKELNKLPKPLRNYTKEKF